MQSSNLEYLKKSISIISKLNKMNHSYNWWAFNFTSKNVLSSKLINQLIIIFNKLDNNDKNILDEQFNELTYIQKKTLLKILKKQILNKHNTYLFCLFIKNVLKSIILLSQSFLFKIFRPKKIYNSDIILFSYVDGRQRDELDTYFGDLIYTIKNDKPSFKINYLFHVYRPYFRNYKNLNNEINDYNSVISMLSFYDFIECFMDILKIWNFNFKHEKLNVHNYNIDLSAIIKETMINEISSGLIDNLLIYRSFCNLTKQKSLKTVIYPFENKSLEKLILLALNKNIQTIGYQHSSITPRHFSLKTNNEELKYMPLPTKIITVGEVTRNWLIQEGGFPENIVHSGVYLRKSKFQYLNKETINLNKIKLLFSFSSSFEEIINTINFTDKNIKKDKFLIKYRFHPDFPVTGLSLLYQNWIKENNILISTEESLKDLIWADIVCYSSSSFSIDSILHNVPVIHLNIDKYNSDPLMNKKVDLKWSVNFSNEFYPSILEISKINKFEKKKRYKNSKRLLDRYFTDKNKINLNLFIES